MQTFFWLIFQNRRTEKVSGKRRRGWKGVEAGSWKAFWQKSLRRGGGGVWTTICADVSTVIILNSACYQQLPPVSHPDSWANTCQLLCHYHLYISQPPHLPLIKLVSSRLTGRGRLAYQTGPIPVNCASESISFLEKKIKTRMLSHYSTIQLSVRKDVRTSCADKKVNSLRFWEDQPL